MNESIYIFVIDLTDEEENKRIDEYSSYFKALRVAANMSQPQVVYSIHSFNPLYEGSIRPMEIGLLTNKDPVDDFTRSHQDPFIARGYDARINEPWSAIDFGSFAFEWYS